LGQVRSDKVRLDHVMSSYEDYNMLDNVRSEQDISGYVWLGQYCSLWITISVFRTY